MAALAPAYRPRRPTETVLYAVVRDWLETFLAHARNTYEAPVPRYVEQELRGYLRCGVFAHGFLRARCDACGHDLLVAFSCKARAACPSCAGRRMANVAAHLVDRVLPAVPVRQWVLSLPFELRRLAAFRADVLTALTRIFHDAVFARYAAWAKKHWLGDDAPTGAVCHIQRFGSSINLHVHFHSMVLDGVFTRDGAGHPVFHPALPPRADELEAVLRRVHRRAVSWLRRRGLLEAEAPQQSEIPAVLDACASVAMQRGSLKSLRDAGDLDEDASSASSTLAPPREEGAVDLEGFNLHASVAIAAADDHGRERLMRYGARAPLALERLRRLPDGRIAYRIKKLRDGRAKHRVMTPLELLARLAALVPPPRYPLLRYAGVLGPRSRWRRDIAPKPPTERGCAARTATARPRPERGETGTGESREHPSHRPDDGADPPTPIAPAQSSAPKLSAPASIAAATAAPTQATVLAANILSIKHWDRLLGGVLYAATPRVDWASLLRRSFEVDVLACARCGGRLRVLGEVTEPTVVRAVLESLGLPTQAPRARRVRDPTDLFDERPAD